jgi:channel protein (hemolysin III family)
VNPETPIYAIPGFNDPVSSWSHLLGAAVFLMWGLFLVQRSTPVCGWPGVARTASLIVFAFSTVLLLSLSGVYHMLPGGSGARHVLHRLDHAAIFVLIAGTYTPVHVILFRGLGRWLPLVLMWSLTAAAVTLKVVFFQDVPEALGVSLYLALGWAGVFTGVAVGCRFGLSFILPLIWGGLAYTAGALLDFCQWPVLLPGVIGVHELFHCFVLAGLACHWTFIFRIASPRYHAAAGRHEPAAALEPAGR